MGADIKEQIISEIDSRLKRLNEHKDDKITNTDNQYDELNQALSKVIGMPLIKELASLKEIINSC